MADNNNQANSFGNFDGFNKIEQEALNRARQMQQHAAPGNHNRQRRESRPAAEHTAGRQTATSAAPESGFNAAEAHQDAHNQDIPLPKGDLMDMIMADKERSLIILLILLLSEDGADTTTLLALMYLIL